MQIRVDLPKSDSPRADEFLTPFKLLSSYGIALFNFEIPGVQRLFNKIDHLLFPLEVRSRPYSSVYSYRRHNLQKTRWAGGVILGGLQPSLALYYKELSLSDISQGII